MSTFDKLLDKKAPYLFFIKFLSCFFILYFFFYFYWGVTGKGGAMFSPSLAENFNIIKGLSSFLTFSAKQVLELFSFNVHQMNFHTLRIDYSKGISVNPDCLGWGVMSFWVAFVFANPGRLQHKSIWMALGLTSVVLLNITRIVLIAISNHRHWKTISPLDHHQTFNILAYGFIFLLMYAYIRVQKKHEAIYLKGTKEDSKTG